MDSTRWSRTPWRTTTGGVRIWPFLPRDVLKLDHAVGLHPSLDGFKRLFDAGKMALVQGVGTPDPNRFHFRSRKIWQTARLGTADEGGRPDRRCLPELGIRVTDGALGENLAVIARSITAGTGVRVFYTSMGGFDTHAFQVVPGSPDAGNPCPSPLHALNSRHRIPGRFDPPRPGRACRRRDLQRVRTATGGE